ncbi:hypothetical protein FXN65_23925 [Metapseudomonas lalkuanensis]|uniref:Uncharacterized protein n=1 Tax=Metapseudomonas lalkuanensis TaxID=2604832 RepID=A0A5J6QW58_9GAMM|nr:hypothetical protein [Pseudomonas lalkuanensis]QEY64959.1 hypothetical protein FXN65_23925 [Pseudomonas lalkuanensis]
MSSLEPHVREFLNNPINSYRRLAEYLNTSHPRSDGILWTKDSAYHFCRTHGIASRRRCRSQPAASISKRKRSRQAIVKALTEALSRTGTSLASLAPFQVSTIARLSGFQLVTVANNWHHLETELLELAKLPPKPVVLHIIDDEV